MMNIMPPPPMGLPPGMFPGAPMGPPPGPFIPRGRFLTHKTLLDSLYLGPTNKINVFLLQRHVHIS